MHLIPIRIFILSLVLAQLGCSTLGKQKNAIEPKDQTFAKFRSSKNSKEPPRPHFDLLPHSDPTKPEFLQARGSRVRMNESSRPTKISGKLYLREGQPGASTTLRPLVAQLLELRYADEGELDLGLGSPDVILRAWTDGGGQFTFSGQVPSGRLVIVLQSQCYELEERYELQGKDLLHLELYSRSKM